MGVDDPEFVAKLEHALNSAAYRDTIEVTAANIKMACELLLQEPIASLLNRRDDLAFSIKRIRKS